MDFRSCINVCVWFSANRKFRYNMSICMQQANYLSISKHSYQVVQPFFLGVNSGNIKGKMKNKTKCNETLIARVVAMVDEDEWSTIQETAESFDKLC